MTEQNADYETSQCALMRWLDSYAHGDNDGFEYPGPIEDREQSMIRLLQKYPQLCEENFYWSDNSLPLHCAVKNGAPLQVLQELVKWYPQALEAFGGIFGSPLHTACGVLHSVDLEVVKLLLVPKLLSTENDRGMLPLHEYCISCGVYNLDIEVVQTLVDAYPDAIKTVNDDGETPLYLT